LVFVVLDVDCGNLWAFIYPSHVDFLSEIWGQMRFLVLMQKFGANQLGLGSEDPDQLWFLIYRCYAGF